MNPRVDFFFNNARKWQEEFEQLRTIVLDCGLSEDLKWGHPCYTLEGRNVVLIHGFKEYCALLFFKGALMKDPKKILIQQTEKVQSARQIRFARAQEIVKLKSVLKKYIKDAIGIEKAGKKVKFKETSEFEVPEEFQDELKKSPSLRKSFNALTPGRQRAYLFHFSSAKQSKTRASRIQKYISKILEGKGMDD